MQLIQPINLDSDLTNDEPLIQCVNQLIQEAVEQNATDIHIEPYESFCQIRYRRQGLLSIIKTFPPHLASRISARLKVLSGLDISERRIPQDGRFQWNNIDIRINVCPIQHGEKLVLRLLNLNRNQLDLHHLGFNVSQTQLFLKALNAPQGLILIAGPTGCGKTLTLYSALTYLNSQAKNISTIEDPIEIQLTGINQMQVNRKIQLDFSTLFRALLRQDPDIIMVGEIRDTETASLAIQAAETGHLVLSTLHTNSSLETLSRLKSINEKFYEVTHALSLIISQRLLRVLCEHCKAPINQHPDILQQWNILPTDIIYQAVGCHHCLHGYQSRTGIFECLPVNNELAILLNENTDIITLKKTAYKAGFQPLLSSAIEKLRAGVTTISEIQRVLGQC